MFTYQIRKFGIDNLELGGLPKPVPEAGEVLVRLHAASLNFRDVMVVNGTYNPRMRLPAIPLSDAAGKVVQVGPGVTKWKFNDQVCSTLIPGWISGGPTAASSKTAIGAGGMTGVACDFALFREDAIVAAPEHLSMDEAATLPCAALTAWHALSVSGHLQPGETVLTL
ncbi:MAG: alcohol dehydrogenase catalytic domain-containing protein, partial [Acidobacteria bacterium]|nr:alcohol dehydrogenase catalytic domain-containing protein [Acidobacteriota bacterium]